MDFKNINTLSTYNDDRVCVLLYNFNAKDLNMLKNICNLIGLKDQIILSPKNATTLVKDILNNNIDESCENGLKHRAVIFNNIDHMKIHSFMDALKKFRIQKPLIAVVTKTSIDWELNTVIQNLIEEKESLKSGKPLNH
ncbi:DUF3783 domain-containing protein [Paraclostridium ghonii]|uniref:DUF3783 domain-containing protein n=1 Tax=Paraclostridium ghonii TaxID=29358 RepID=UPI00202CB694|nr:DUF3783 domain-containing protein [Paeniclostridium ghonii]MCM0167560.1 DUF3783 domain-containing protein [Paeniclostridium ghonii]